MKAPAQTIIYQRKQLFWDICRKGIFPTQKHIGCLPYSPFENGNRAVRPNSTNSQFLLSHPTS